MAVDAEYLDDLMKSIEPVVYPDGAPQPEPEEEEQGEEVFGEEEEYSDSYEKDIADIPEIKNSEADNQPDKVMETDEDDNELPKPEDNDEVSKEDEAGEELEFDLDMSAEEIDALLNAAKEVKTDNKLPLDADAEMTDILSMFGDDEDISDIKDTLEKADNNIAVDEAALESAPVELPNIEDEEETAKTEEAENGDKKKNKEKKAKKDKKDKKGDGKGKEPKKGFLARILSALTEEVEEDAVAAEELTTGVTDENADILRQLDSEEDDKGKKKKKKKDKKGKDSKEKPETEGSEKDIREKEGDDSAEDSDGGKKKKSKKEKKPKKEKAPAVEEKPSKKLPKKRVRNTIILCASILAAIIILSVFLTDFLTKKQARYAFINQDYETSYSELYGMELKGEDKVIFDKSMTIMLLQRKIDSYNNYMQLGMKAEALNALLEGYKEYPAVNEMAENNGVTAEVAGEYKQILEYLGKFGISSEDAQQIVDESSVVTYNKTVKSIAEGHSYTGTEAGDADSQSQTDGISMDDILPEELDMLPDNPEDVFE